MAEYITKEQALENFENAYQSSEDSQEFRYYFKSFVDCIPAADVIERSNIDKAIEEIEGEYSTCNQDWIDGLNRALEILKRNIGE